VKDYTRAVFHLANAVVVTGNPNLVNLFAAKLDGDSREMLLKALPAADEVSGLVPLSTSPPSLSNYSSVLESVSSPRPRAS
jgi:hypothetical protein